MAPYLLESSLCWLLFYGFYALTLSRETFFKLNRWYLLSTLALGALIPHLEIPVSWVMQTPEISLTTWLPMAQIGANAEIVIRASAEGTFDIWRILMPVYWLGVAITGFRFLYGLSQITRLFLKGQKSRYPDYTLIVTESVQLPFSFGSCLFVSRHSAFNAEDLEKITKHELEHIAGRHTLDVLLLELACIFLWWSLPLYWYRRSLRTVHEYLADHAVLRTARRKEYGHLLIRQAHSGLQPALANHFFHSQLKKRITMMTKTKSGKSALLKYLTVFPLLVLAMLLFANREALAQATVLDQPVVVVGFQEKAPESNFHVVSDGPAQLVISDSKDEPQPLYFIDGKEVDQKEIAALNPGNIERVEVLKGEAAIKLKGDRAANGVILITTKKNMGEVDEMPRFPGCEELKEQDARSSCSTGKLMAFIGENLKYPKVAKESAIEGTVVVSFAVNADGSLTDIAIVKSIGGGTDEEVKRVIGLMPKWIPAQKDGKAVKSEMKLPIKFKLDANQPATGGDEVFKVVEEMPRFPGEGCENSELDQAAKKQCADRAMLEFIYKGIKYPKAAREAGIEGVVVVSFVVDKSGKIRDAKIERSIGGGCDEEVLRLVGEMPDWIPGKQRGRLVNVQFNMPIKFKLEGPAPKPEGSATPQPQAMKKVFEPANFSASPNPASRQVRVYFEADVKPVTIRIVDAAQKVIFEQSVNAFNGVYDKTINLAGAPKGVVYIMVSQEGSEPFVHKLVVQ